MGLATLLHWDRFNHGHISFWLWAVVYAITPFLVLFVWILMANSGRPTAGLLAVGQLLG